MASSTEKTPRPAGLKLLVFYSIPLLLILMIAECGLKLFDAEQIMVREDDPQMVYSFYPERRGISATPEYRVEVETDARGLRGCDAIGPETTGAAPRKLLILGDSFAEGWGVPCEKTFAGLLDGRPGLSAANGGLHGGSPGYYILRYRVLKTIEHDTLVVQLFDNDLDDLDKFAPYVLRDEAGRLAAGRAAGLGPIPPGAFSRFLKNRGIYRAIKRIYYGLRGQPLPIKYYRPGREPDDPILTHAQALEKFGGLAPLDDPEKSYGGQFAFYKYDSSAAAAADPLWSSRFRRMEIYLRQLIEEARADRPERRIVLVYVPAKEAFAPGGILGRGPARPLTVDELRAANPFYRLIRRTADETGSLLVDGQEVLRADAVDLYFPGDAHLNVTGHARLAAALERALGL